RVIGGAPVAPTRALAESTVRAAGSLAELVLVDAPVLADERGLALASRAERVLVLSYDDPLSLATLDAVDLPNAAWLVASQSRTARVGERAAFRALPRDEMDAAKSYSSRFVGFAAGSNISSSSSARLRKFDLPSESAG